MSIHLKPTINLDEKMNIYKLWILFLMLPLSNVDAGGWTSFRNGGVSKAPESKIMYPVNWSPLSGIAWQKEVEGYGQSTPVIWNDRIYLSSVKGKMKEQCVLNCFDLQTGNQIWKHEKSSGEKAASNYRVARAAPTPLVDESGIYVFYESGDLLALDHSKQVLWQRNLSHEFGKFKNHHGLGSSPAQSKDLLFLNVEHNGPSYFIAIEKNTGKTKWKINRPSGMSWTSPIVASNTVDQTEAVIISSNGRVDAYDSQNGKLLWGLGDLGGNSVPSPTFVDGLLFIGARIPQFGTQSAGSRSNLCLNLNHIHKKPSISWRAQKAVSDYTSPVISGECVYLINKVGVLYCLDINTGKQHFAKRLKEPCWATPVVIGKLIYLFGKNGGTLVLENGTQYKEIALNRLWAEKNPPAPENYVEYTGTKTEHKKKGDQQRRGGGIGAMLLENDKNNDGLISKAELPERFKAMMMRVDRNQDQVIDKEEIAWMEKKFREERANSRTQARDPIVYGVAAARGRIVIRTGTRLYCIEGNEK
ncbi:outer membrane biogenesis protein BamB [Gimesia aquarii]|uniref:Outer membrane biogenesis protein BamB n=2 Tax=Gimesia aquarii TaxID=2527964 RepID=A0A517WZ35_9PLAN|nr:outer membrane biogenesis protein BamB [Gimesia aquarii]